MNKSEESQAQKSKSDFLTRNQDVIAGWKPQAMTYSTRERSLQYCEIVPLPFETVKTRVNGTIWAYHVASGQQAITPYQEKYCGCFLVQKSKARQPPGELERISEHFHLPESYKQQQKQPRPSAEPPVFRLYDQDNQEVVAQHQEPDFFEQSDQPAEPQQEALDLRLEVPFVRVVYRDMDRSKGFFATPIPRGAQENSAPLLPPGKGPFSTIRQKNRPFQTPNAQYSVKALRGTDPTFSAQQIPFHLMSPGFDQFPLLEITTTQPLPPQPAERPPRLPRK